MLEDTTGVSAVLDDSTHNLVGGAKTPSISGSVASKYSNSSAFTTTGKSKRKKKREEDQTLIKPEVTQEAMQHGLSQLGRTADGLRPTYLRLQLDGMNMANADFVSGYPHLQTVLLRNDDLVDIKGLSNLLSLTELDVSSNKLTNVLEFHSDPKITNLRIADFSSNLISSIGDLSSFSRLTALQISDNTIERLTGLRNLVCLETLNLSKNKLISVRGMETLSRLKYLDVSGNSLTNLEPLSSLSSLEVLLASRNKLEHLRGLGSLKNLRTLDVSHNSIPSLHDLSYLHGAEQLSELTTTGNPLEACNSIRLHIVDLLPQVFKLNGLEISFKEKVLSANMHGADSEALRIIRRKHFLKGEIDGGGGAIPPPAAGLIASNAEEEKAEGGALDGSFLRIDAWASSLAPGRSPSGESPAWWLAAEAAARVGHKPDPPPIRASAVDFLPFQDVDNTVPADFSLQEATTGASLESLAEALASVCGDSQALLARACWSWVTTHVLLPSKKLSWSVTAPLFGPGEVGLTAEAALLGSGSESGGAWAERASWLFVELAKMCRLEAVMIPGFWRDGTLTPGSRLEAHNHCWAAVKVNSRWRLLDLTLSVLAGGPSGSTPFFVPPLAFSPSHLPLEAQWQLLPDPVLPDVWWSSPECSVSFFSRGCLLLSPHLKSSNLLPCYKEGDRLPALEIDIAAPSASSPIKLTHALIDAQSGRVLAEWPPRGAGSVSSGETFGSPQLAFQQAVYTPGDDTSKIVEFGASSWVAQATRIYTAFPAPGEYLVEVRHILEIPGGLPVRVEGLSEPLLLNVVQSDEVLRVKVVVPDPEVHDPEDGVLHDAFNPPQWMPYAHPSFARGLGLGDVGSQLVSPLPTHSCEADRTEVFEVIVPHSVSQVLLVDPAYGSLIAELERGSSKDQDMSLSLHRFTASVVTPRLNQLEIVAVAEGSDHHIPLLTFTIKSQQQHIVDLAIEEEVPTIDRNEPKAHQASEIFEQLDLDNDGKVTRREMLVSIRRNRQVADILGLPARISLHDGTFDRWVEGFLNIDTSKLGSFSFSELCHSMGIRASADDEEEEEEEEEEEGGVYEE